VGTGSRKENAKKQRKDSSVLPELSPKRKPPPGGLTLPT
jgi:hypothetical protein